MKKILVPTDFSDCAEAATDFAIQLAKKPVDLIAICTHGRKGLQRLFSPSIAERLANQCERPLWSIRL